MRILVLLFVGTLLTSLNAGGCKGSNNCGGGQFNPGSGWAVPSAPPPPPAPKDCEMGEWGSWTECDKKCGGGNQSRSRVVTHQPAYGGRECGRTQEHQTCNSHSCSVDCVMSDWSDWSACTVNCGGGQQTRSRRINIASQNGGLPCGNTLEVRNCNSQPCPINCVLTAWTGWSECNARCGGGQQTRNRYISVTPQFGGSACGQTSEAQACNTQPCPINCQMSAFSGWSGCSVTCGGGVQTRNRQIIQQAAYGGQACGATIEIQGGCNPQACPPRFGYQGGQESVYINGQLKRVDHMRECKDYGSHLACSNVIANGRGLQTILGCPSATPQLRQTCADTWTVSLQDCCWCDENGNRCLLRASKPEAYIVPKGVIVTNEPHFRDWLGRSWDYQGRDDHVLIEVPGYRVEVKLTKCSPKSSVTCISEAAFVNTVSHKSIQFKAGNPVPFTCNGPIQAVNGEYIVDDIKAEIIDKGHALAKFSIKMGEKLTAEVVVDKELLDIIAEVTRKFKDGDIKGGLLTGCEAKNVKSVWGAGQVEKRQELSKKAIRVGEGKAWATGLSWRLKPSESHICSTKLKPYDDKVPQVLFRTRLRNNITNDLRLKYNECCFMLSCSPESYDECVFDHFAMGATKCIAGYNTIAEEECQRRGFGDCKGGYTTWSSCVNGRATRRYIIEKNALPGFENCPHEHDYEQTVRC